MFQLLDVFGQFCGAELPIEAEVIEHALLGLPPFGYLAAVVPGGIAVPSTGRCRIGDLNLLALQAVENGSVVARVEVRALGVHPALALVAHDPLLAVVAEVEVDLLAVEAEGLLLVLAQAVGTQPLDVIFVGEVVLAGLVGRTDLVAADVGAEPLLLGRLVLAGGRARVGLARRLLVVLLDLLGNAGTQAHPMINNAREYIKTFKWHFDVSKVLLRFRLNNRMIFLKQLRRLVLFYPRTQFFCGFFSAKPAIARLSDAGEQAVWAH